jgi:energy-coupling factor transporter ATP-binding protein EcfA2
MGASDAGKTTLCLLLAGLAPHLTEGTMEGRVVICGRDTRHHPPPALADTAGLLFQEPEAQLFSQTVKDEVAWGLENLGLPPAEIRRRVGDYLAMFGLDRLAGRSPQDLSGGEMKRLALASVLALQPDVLILDEPVGGLDPAGRRELLAFLARLRAVGAGRPVTIVMIESDPEPVLAFADRLVILHDGRVGAEGAPRDLFRQPARLAPLGVAIPQLASLAAALGDRLGADFDWRTLDEARAELAVRLG